MRTYIKQRSEFIVLSMKLIDKDRLTHPALFIYPNMATLIRSNDEDISIIHTSNHNEVAIQKLRDLLRG